MRHQGQNLRVVAVGQLSLGLRPHELVGVEFGRVAWKRVALHAAMPAQPSLDVRPTVDCPAVPQQDHGSAQMAEQVTDEAEDPGAGEVPQVKLKVQADVATLGRHGDRRDRRDFVAAVAVAQHGGAAHGGPGLPHVGDE